MHKLVQDRLLKGKAPRVLNLFAYSGLASLFTAQAGAEVCHVDSSKGMIDWARENIAINNLTKAPVRWIVDDVIKFLRREAKRGQTYDGILLDPPSFGRGKKGELFKIEEHLSELLRLCKQVLSKDPLFFLLSCHTPGYTPVSLKNILLQVMKVRENQIESGETLLESPKDKIFSIPSGSYARWSNQ